MIILVVIWLILLTLYLIFQNSVKDFYFNHLKNKLSNNWLNPPYKKEFDEFREFQRQKKEKYLKDYLKEECYKCKTFNNDGTDNYFCAVEDNCPGLDLRLPEKKELIKNHIKG